MSQVSALIERSRESSVTCDSVVRRKLLESRLSFQQVNEKLFDVCQRRPLYHLDSKLRKCMCISCLKVMNNSIHFSDFSMDNLLLILEVCLPLSPLGAFFY